MLINIWSISLFICALAVVFLFGRAAITAIRVLRYWENGSDSALQIRLESETCLSAALVESGLIVQTMSLLLLVFAAEEFSHVLAGAMCATGAFVANEYGFWSISVKLAAIFLYGFWIVVNRLDVQSEFYPLTRIKHLAILLLLPVVGVDIVLQSLYLYNLTPDIITSCCGVIFSGVTEGELGLSYTFSVTQLFLLFYLFATLLLVLKWIVIRGKTQSGRWKNLIYAGISLGWLFYFPYGLYVITIVISSYIYAMPYHHCPFDMLKGEYYRVGYPIYITFIGAAFLGICSGVVGIASRLPGLLHAVRSFQNRFIVISFCLLIAFLIVVSYAPLLYYFNGGEVVF